MLFVSEMWPSNHLFLGATGKQLTSLDMFLMMANLANPDDTRKRPFRRFSSFVATLRLSRKK
jgi:hypothetical protein